MRIGVDLGGTNIKAGAVDDQGRILLQNTRPTLVDRGVEPIIHDIIQQIEELIEDTKTTIEQIQSIGIGVPGLVEAGSGRVIYVTNLFWRDVPLGERLKEHFKRPVYVDNDATVAALAEKIAGSTMGIQNAVTITLGTGVGGGMIVNNQVYRGQHGWGSEIGHMVVGENFYNCNCGQEGCLETFVSATAIIKYARKRIEEGFVDTLILEKAGGDLEKIQAKTVFDAARQGDPLGLEVFQRFIKYLSLGIVNLYNILDPERIVIGGGISKAGDFILAPLREEVQKRTFSKEVAYGDIVIAELGNEAGIIGAAFLGDSR